jgi:nitrogenase molybdenum-iron protein alpha chain
MNINTNENEAATRENRLGSITGYSGTVKDLVSQSTCGSLKNKERCFTQTSACSSGCAMGYLSGIVDAAIINHAPIGCASDAVYGNTTNKWGEKVRGWKHRNISLISTNMNENDTVFGATAKLKKSIFEAYRRFAPKAIFITTSCVSGVIGEDIKSVIDEVRDEIPIPVVPVFCEGFKSKIWASGFDAAFHALLTGIVKSPQKKNNRVNMINFRGSAKDEIGRILGKLGLEPVFVVPFSTIDELSRLSESVATISICGTLGSYLGNGLEQKYGVPYIKALQPHGIAGFESWLRSLGKATGKEKEVEAIIDEEKNKILPDLAEIRGRLNGFKAVVGMGPSFAHNYIRVLNELGVEVVWGASWHFDQHYDHGSTPESTKFLSENEKDLPVSICDQQNFEILNLLNRIKPDLYISRHGGTAVWATKMGIASVMVADEYSAFGYQGLIDFGYRLIDAVTNRSLAKTLAKRVKLPYTDWWLSQETFKFLQEKAVV